MSTPATHNPNATTPRVFPRTPETHQRAGGYEIRAGRFPGAFKEKR